jgi:tetratricopeptide (TPR) repeat protein
MILVDARGYTVTGATATALDLFELALAKYQSWRGGAREHLSSALREAPEFVMAHVLQAYLDLSSRDPNLLRAARPALKRAATLPANSRELLHLAAISAVLVDDYEGAKRLLGKVLSEYPRDALALQVAHALDYVTGDVARMEDRVAAVLNAWSSALPGYPAVLAMHGFSLEECGRYAKAEEVARRALALDAFDARAHHVLAHVFEMTGRPEAGIRWMYEHVPYWAVDTVVATHGWWHVALFHLATGDPGQALHLYDRRIRVGQSTVMSDMIDAASLLWRVALRGGEPGERWGELAAAWAPHIDDQFCTFSDIHAMLAFVGARRWDYAGQLERELGLRQGRRTRYGHTTRHMGLPASRALIAFGRGTYARAVTLLSGLSPSAHRIGGSHAQRDVLALTLRRALDSESPLSTIPGRNPRRAALPPREPTCVVIEADD